MRRRNGIELFQFNIEKVLKKHKN